MNTIDRIRRSIRAACFLAQVREQLARTPDDPELTWASEELENTLTRHHRALNPTAGRPSPAPLPVARPAASAACAPDR